DVGRGIEAGNGTQGLHVENCVFGLIGKIAIRLSSDKSDVETGSATIRNCKFLSTDGTTKKEQWGIYLASISSMDLINNPITNVEISDCEFQHHKLAIGINEGAG